MTSAPSSLFDDVHAYDPARFPFAAHAKRITNPKSRDSFAHLSSFNTTVRPAEVGRKGNRGRR